MTLRNIGVFLLYCMAASVGVSKNNPVPLREDISFNQGWLFSMSKHNNQDNKDVVWDTVNIPHTWNRFDATDNLPGYRRDTGYYKKTFIPDICTSCCYVLHFEAVNNTAGIFINDKKVGEHIGGYLGFSFDITSYIIPGVTNTILVVADNTVNRDIIPSYKSDFIIFGGIVRDVWLKHVPVAYINKVYIQTPEVNSSFASTTVKVITRHTYNGYTLKAEIADKHGRKLMETSAAVASDTALLVFEKMQNPNLWSPDTPTLYSMHISLCNENELIDTITEYFGYRWFAFKEGGPFYLNGKRLLLRGTHRHEDHAGYGMAVPNNIHWQDMQMIKEMGANFVRLGHYPQDPEVYKACDKLGLLVWDELPWCRGGIGKDVWKNNTRRMLVEMLEQNYNHPSIIMWSLGNEVDWQSDFPDGNNFDSIKNFLAELNDMAKSIDPYRETAIRRAPAAVDIVDVYSPSIWSGWYAGVYKGYLLALEKARKAYPRFMHIEYGGDSHIGRHVERPITGDGVIPSNLWEESENQAVKKSISNEGDWSESYIVDLFDWYLHITENLDWYSGGAQWIFKDFATPLRPENPIPYINQKGLMDRAGKPKDAYYVFKSYWTTAPAFTYIESHTWTEKNASDGNISQQCVFSNCEQVELIVNGKSLEKKTADKKLYPAKGLSWPIKYVEGNNSIVAIGYNDNRQVAYDSILVNYVNLIPQAPDRLALSYVPYSDSTVLIKARMHDWNGNLCTSYNKRIYFSHTSGQGKLLTDYGTNTRSQIIEMANGTAAIEFVYVKGATAIITANADGKDAVLEITVP